jgi:hypothetical protein
MAIALENLKISPAAAYGIQLIWQDLKEQDLIKRESTKATFLKTTVHLQICDNQTTVHFSR